MQLSICFFNGPLSSVILVDGDNGVLVFSIEGSAPDGVVAAVVVVINETVVPPVFLTSADKAHGCFGVGLSLFLL